VATFNHFLEEQHRDSQSLRDFRDETHWPRGMRLKWLTRRFGCIARPMDAHLSLKNGNRRAERRTCRMVVEITAF
jgi:hypothetical protein